MDAITPFPAADAATTARDKYRQVAAEAHRDWRLTSIQLRRDMFAQREIVKLGIGELAALRLQLAFVPMLGTLATIEEKLFRLMKACSYDHMDKWQGRAGR